MKTYGMGVLDKSDPEVAVRCQLLVLLVEVSKEEGFGGGVWRGSEEERKVVRQSDASSWY